MVVIRMIVVRTVNPIGEKTLNFASICFESCFISIIIVETVCLTYASAPAGENFGLRVQNRLVFRYFFSKFYSEIH